MPGSMGREAADGGGEEALAAAPTAMEEEEVDCSICLQAVVVAGGGGRSTVRLQCSHEFHLDCIGSAFNFKGQMQCPNCRTVEDGKWLGAGPKINMDAARRAALQYAQGVGQLLRDREAALEMVRAMRLEVWECQQNMRTHQELSLRLYQQLSRALVQRRIPQQYPDQGSPAGHVDSQDADGDGGEREIGHSSIGHGNSPDANGDGGERDIQQMSSAECLQFVADHVRYY